MNNDIVYNESHAPETVAEQQQLDLHHPPAAESHIIPSSVDKQSRFHRFVVQWRLRKQWTLHFHRF